MSSFTNLIAKGKSILNGTFSNNNVVIQPPTPAEEEAAQIAKTAYDEALKTAESTPSQPVDNPNDFNFNFSSLYEIADSNNNGQLSLSELEQINSLADLNNDGNITELELEILRTIALSDGKKGINDKERETAGDIRQFIASNNIDLTKRNNIEALKKVVAYYYGVNTYVPPVIDLDQDKRQDKFEQELYNKGVTNNPEGTELLKSIADSNGDGVVTNNEYQTVKSFLDFNTDGKIDINELKLLAHIANLNKEKGLDEDEMIIAKELQMRLESIKNDSGTAFTIDDANLERGRTWIDKQYTIITNPDPFGK